MIKKESDCVGCGLPCWHSACPHYEVKVKICDRCENEVEKLYWNERNGVLNHLCINCMQNKYRIRYVNCSECGTIIDDLEDAYVFDDETFCSDCFEKQLDEVKVDV